MSNLKKGDRVVATYKGSKFVGTIKSIDEKHWEAGVQFAPGVDMLLPLTDIELIDQEGKTHE